MAVGEMPLIPDAPIDLIRARATESILGVDRFELWDKPLDNH